MADITTSNSLYNGMPYKWAYTAYLPEDEQAANVDCFAAQLYASDWAGSYVTKYPANGWTLNAIAGWLGNVEAECGMNPGLYEGRKIGDSNGFGLVQWTPGTKLRNWLAEEGLTPDYDPRNQIWRMAWEMQNGEQWYGVSGYGNMTFYEFSQSTKDPGYLAEAFYFSYERSAAGQAGTRPDKAEKWYKYLLENPPQSGKVKSRSNLIYYMKRRKHVWP